MTIKNQDKIVSEENQDVVTDATLSNGILTLIRRNLYSGIVDHENDIEIDLSDHKLKLKIVTQERLTALENSTNQSDIKERESYIFLVSLGESSSEGYYREYIWVQGNNSGEFEAIGSTKIDLTNYIQKTSGTNLLLANGENIAQSTFATAAALTGKENTSNKVTAMSSSSTNTQYPSAKAVYDALPKTTKTLTVTYTNGTTEDIEFYIKWGDDDGRR